MISAFRYGTWYEFNFTYSLAEREAYYALARLANSWRMRANPLQTPG